GMNDGLVHESLTRTVRLLARLARQQDVTLDLEIAGNLPPVTADDGTLREIFFNLVANSIEAAGRGGRVFVTCRADETGVVAEVRDTGPGLPDMVRDRLFEPLVTTKET